MSNQTGLLPESSVQPAQLLTSAVEQSLRKLEDYISPPTVDDRFPDPVHWIESNFYVPNPRDHETGEYYKAGPIRLSPLQRRIIQAALARDSHGLLEYTTIIYSCPKKSGKSTIASAVASYLADVTPYGQVYFLANDGKSASDRLYGPVLTNFRLHRNLGGKFRDVRPTDLKTVLPNYAKFEPIPCDARGEAGSEPTGVFISEVWGYDTEAKRRLFTEMTVPPTLWGYAVRWIETYAGYKGQSDLLWDLYKLGVLDGTPHPDFTDVVDNEDNPVVWENKDARVFAYWDHVPRMVWQNDDYYNQEAKILPPQEFERIHRNRWVEPVGAFIDGALWDRCFSEHVDALIDDKTPVVVAIDAAVSGDCAAIVAVTRDTLNPFTDVMIRGCRIFKPGAGQTLDLEQTLGKTLREWSAKWNIVCVTYDEYQMAKMVKDYEKGVVGLRPEDIPPGLSPEELADFLREQRKLVQLWYRKFSQQGDRAVADKMLYDMVVNRNIWWNHLPGEQIAKTDEGESLEKHIKQAGSKLTGDSRKRLEKLSTDSKIDAAVALSMAVYVAIAVLQNMGNNELNKDSLVLRLKTGEITMQEFELAMLRLRTRQNG